MMFIIKTTIKKSLLAGVFLCLMGVCFVSAQVVVVCDIDQSAWSGWNEVCLPTLRGNFVRGMTDQPSDGLVANVWGKGADFASAWEDAEANCRSMAIQIESAGAYAMPAGFTCPINSCVEFSTAKGRPIPTQIRHGICMCHSYVNNTCQKTERHGDLSGQTGQDIYTQGMQLCAQSARSLNRAVSVLCWVP